MSLISVDELLAIQEVAESGMSGEATILKRVTIETANGLESVWAQSGESVSCWLYQQTGPGNMLGAISGAIAEAQNFSIRVPVGTDVDSGDEIAIGSTIYSVQNTNAGETYSPWLDCTCRIVE